MPLDAETVTVRARIAERGVFMLIDGKATDAVEVEAHLNHWATCPSASQHRTPATLPIEVDASVPPGEVRIVGPDGVEATITGVE